MTTRVVLSRDTQDEEQRHGIEWDVVCPCAMTSRLVALARRSFDSHASRAVSHTWASYIGVSRTSPPMRPFCSSVWRSHASSQHTPEAVQPRLQLTFTCTVPQCGTRSTHEFTKHSYTKGIVLVQCPGCKNRHLIADNLGWFAESKGEPRTVEEIVRAHGGRVRTGTVYSDVDNGETVEIESDSHDDNVGTT